MPTQTILWIPIAHRRYAETNGAKYDAKLGVWCVEGNIPPALIDYVSVESRTREPIQEIGPRCPHCGQPMAWVDSDRPFWGCRKYRNVDCRSIQPADYLPHVCTSSTSGSAPPHYPECSSALVRGIHLHRILSLLHQCVENDEGILMWLNQNRAELGGKSALELMETGTGFQHVEAFILNAFDLP